MKQTKTTLAAFLTILLFLGGSACSLWPEDSLEPTSSQSSTPAPVTIRYLTFRCGNHDAAAAEKIFIDGFTEEYEGKIELKVEYLPSDQVYYDKLKVLASSNDLPDVFEGNLGILETAVSSGQAVDMTDYLNADLDYKNSFSEEALNAGQIDGKQYAISYGLQIVGYYYNKEMFERAGIRPAETWDEFLENCEALKAQGDIPLSLMTGENCWITNLVLSAVCGTSGERGNVFVNTKNPETYQTEEFISALDFVKTLLCNYSTPDVVNLTYAAAADYFLSEKTAMIPNGSWMVPDFENPDKTSPGFADKIGVALFPQHSAVYQYELGFSIAKSDEKTQRAAFEFIKYKTCEAGQLIHFQHSGVLPLNIIDESSIRQFKGDNPVLNLYLQKIPEVKTKYRSINMLCKPATLEKLPGLYERFIAGDIDARQFAKELDQK